MPWSSCHRERVFMEHDFGVYKRCADGLATKASKGIRQRLNKKVPRSKDIRTIRELHGMVGTPRWVGDVGSSSVSWREEGVGKRGKVAATSMFH